jgi:hypothetical protein
MTSRPLQPVFSNLDFHNVNEERKQSESQKAEVILLKNEMLSNSVEVQ